VVVAGGAEAAQQYLAAGLLDEMQIHVAPLLLGGGTRLFDDAFGKLELVRTIASPIVTHLRYRVVK
jgi:dihydrofolate reductase